MGSLAHLTDEQLRHYHGRYKAEMNKGKRFENRKRFGTDTKYLYHIFRLLDEAEQILTTGDLDLQRAREEMKSIRRGEWPESRIREVFEARLPGLEKAYAESPLPAKPDEAAIKQLLLDCLEQHYGRLDGCVVREESPLRGLREIAAVVDRLKAEGVIA